MRPWRSPESWRWRSAGVVSGVLAGKGLLKELVGLRMLTTVSVAETLALLLVVATISRFDYCLGAIGGLVLGASLSGLPHRMRDDILPGVRRAADAFFVPLFFASAGLYLDLSFLALPAATIAALVCIPLAGKFAGALLGARLAGLDTPFAVATGQMAKGATEIALLVVLLESGAIGGEVFSLPVLVMFGCILLAPRAWPDEPIDDVLQRMAGHWMTVAPVTDPRTGDFLGTVTSHDLLDLVALIDEIEDEVQRQGAGT